jgi:hypothetical protein
MNEIDALDASLDRSRGVQERANAWVDDSPLIESPDGWSVPSMRGCGVSKVVLNYQVHLHVGSDTVVIESPFPIERENAISSVFPESQEGVAAAEALRCLVVSGVDVAWADQVIIRERANQRRPPRPELQLDGQPHACGPGQAAFKAPTGKACVPACDALPHEEGPAEPALTAIRPLRRSGPASAKAEVTLARWQGQVPRAVHVAAHNE